MTLSQAKAQTQSCSTTKVKEACDKALKAADEVIEEQGNLLILVGAQNNELIDENQRLSDAVVELKDVVDDNEKNTLWIGALGIAVGITAGLLVPR